MKTTELLNLIAERFELKSDYKIAQFLRISQTSMTDYRRKGKQFGDETAIKAAKLLGLDPAEVLASIYAERTNCPEVKAVWERVAKTMHTTAISLIIGVILCAGITPSIAKDAANRLATNIHYTHWLNTLLRRTKKRNLHFRAFLPIPS